MVGHEEAVEPRDQVEALIHEGNVAAWHARSGDRDVAQENPVADDSDDGCDDLGADALVPYVEKADDEIADGDALEDSIDAEMIEREERKAVDDAAEREDDESPLHGVAGKLGARCSALDAGMKGEHDGGADDEDKGGEDEVGGGEAVPLGVVHEVPGAGAAVVVDHDHEGDGDAAEYVKREQALWGRGGGCRICAGGGARGGR